MGLLALFTILRAHGEDRQQGARYILQPGVIEFQTAEGGGRIAFGLLDLGGKDGRGRSWSLLPLRVSLSSGRQSFSLALNGFSLLAPGARIGRPVRITGLKTGNVISVGGDVTVAGTVKGNVWTLGAKVRLLPQAVVTGSVVALGGTIEAGRGALIRGNRYSLPNLKIPLLSLLSSGQSAATFRFLIELMGVLLYLLLLFLAVHFALQRLIGLVDTLGSSWKGSLLYLVFSVLVLAAAVALLVATILGILLVPFLVLAAVVLGYVGYLASTVRLGLWIRGQKPAVAAGKAYTSGLLGLLVIKGPAVLGIIFGLLASQTLQAVGSILYVVGTVEMIVAALYGFGGSLRYLRVRG
jgi:hypothetical protein